MAKKEDKPKVVLERVYNVPLRKEFQKVPKYKRAKKAVTALRKYLKRHMKSDSIKIGKHVNEQIWQRGIRNPPHHVKINVVKDDKGTVIAELVGKPIFDEPPKEEKAGKGKKKKPEEEKKEKKKEAEEKKPEKPKDDEKKKEELAAKDKDEKKSEAKTADDKKDADKKSEVKAEPKDKKPGA